MATKTNVQVEEKGPAGLEMGPLMGFAGYLLRRAFLTSNQLFLEIAGEMNIAPGQYSVFKIVQLNEGSSQTEVAAAAGVDRSSLIQILDQLRKKDLVEVRAGKDRRTSALFLSPQGKKLADQIDDSIQRHEALITRSISREERAELLRILTKMVGLDSQS